MNTTRELANKTQEFNKLSATFESQIQKIREQIQHDSDLKSADKKALKRLEDKYKKENDDLKKNYDKLIADKQAANDLLLQQTKDIPSFQYGLNSYLKDLKAAGCVVDPRQRKSMALYFPKTPKLNGEITVELYRAQNEYVGKLKVSSGGTGLRGEVVETASGQTVKPMDWFRLP